MRLRANNRLQREPCVATEMPDAQRSVTQRVTAHRTSIPYPIRS